ncbi:hypothetical protein F5Y04DRAFT_290848 [Hypomontagnella monticulosa]|nr:hypothetical protein F5Y04DRAFT_290848 [Hypomontagnella monticulosa]
MAAASEITSTITTWTQPAAPPGTGSVPGGIVVIFTSVPGETTLKQVSSFTTVLEPDTSTVSSITSSSSGSTTNTPSTSNASISASQTTSNRPSNPTSSPPTTSTPPASPANPSLSNGATAGIAVGCAAIGLILGLIVGFLIFRRRRSRQSKAKYHAVELDGQEKPLRYPLSADKLQLDQFLLNPTPDAEISTELHSLAQLLQQHVEDHYHTSPVFQDVEALSVALVQLGLDQSGTMPASKLASLTQDPKSRYHAIQHIIARVTFSSVSFDTEPPISLLPKPVSSFVSMIPITENHRGNPEAIKAALTRWRQLSAFLLHPSRSDRTPLIPAEDASTHQAQQLALALNTFLGPFVKGDREDRFEQENHLREVMVECATFGYLIFSQPSEYRFRFEVGARPNYIVTFPGLDRIRDEEGNRYPPSTQPVVAPIVESI